MRNRSRCTAKTWILSLTVLLLPAVLVAETGGLRYTVAVTNFDNESGWHGQWDLGHAWDTVLTDLLNDTLADEREVSLRRT